MVLWCRQHNRNFAVDERTRSGPDRDSLHNVDAPGNPLRVAQAPSTKATSRPSCAVGRSRPTVADR